MIKMKLIRELRFEDVRRICIDNNFYTNGTNEEYNKLKNYIDEVNDMTDDKLIKVARDIQKHSITDYSLTTIITLLNEKIFIYSE